MANKAWGNPGRWRVGCRYACGPYLAPDSALPSSLDVSMAKQLPAV
ncbi:hypothetical protein [Serratia odorifera]|nr:hypothetical protein [Serratia odorifera]MBJ2064833.1 hypothetical protein [Serratia odorifera]